MILSIFVSFVVKSIEGVLEMEVVISFPDNLPDLLHETPEEFEREARMAMAAKLFERKRLSSGIAAQLAGMERAEFLLELHRYGVPMIDISDEKLALDAENA